MRSARNPPEGFGSGKQKTSNKIDAAVALSFAVLAAVQAGRPLSLEDIRGYKPPEVVVMSPEQIVFGVKDYHWRADAGERAGG